MTADPSRSPSKSVLIRVPEAGPSRWVREVGDLYGATDDEVCRADLAPFSGQLTIRRSDRSVDAGTRTMSWSTSLRLRAPRRHRRAASGLRVATHVSA
jgi:hypothetical protein